MSGEALRNYQNEDERASKISRGTLWAMIIRFVALVVLAASTEQSAKAVGNA